MDFLFNILSFIRSTFTETCIHIYVYVILYNFQHCHYLGEGKPQSLSSSKVQLERLFFVHLTVLCFLRTRSHFVGKQFLNQDPSTARHGNIYL